jgi:hypothetical protein
LIIFQNFGLYLVRSRRSTFRDSVVDDVRHHLFSSKGIHLSREGARLLSELTNQAVYKILGCPTVYDSNITINRNKWFYSNVSAKLHRSKEERECHGSNNWRYWSADDKKLYLERVKNCPAAVEELEASVESPAKSDGEPSVPAPQAPTEASAGRRRHQPAAEAEQGSATTPGQAPPHPPPRRGGKKSDCDQPLKGVEH